MHPFQRLVALCQKKPAEVVTRVMLEQEYWLFDRAILQERPDLQAGQLLFGEPSKPGEVMLVPVHQVEKTREQIQETALRRNQIAVFHPEKRIQWAPEIKGGAFLLDPKRDPLLFLFIAVAVLQAIQDHRGLLSAALDSPFDTPPIGLSQEVADVMALTLGWSPILAERPLFSLQNGGVFLSAGSSESFTLQIFEAVVVDQLTLLLDEAESCLARQKGERNSILRQAATQWLKEVASLLFARREAGTVSLGPLNWSDGKTARALQPVLSDQELARKMNALFESHARKIEEEAKLIVDVFGRLIVPALAKFHENPLLQASLRMGQDIEQLGAKAAGLGWQAKATVFSKLLAPKVAELKRNIAALEKLVGKEVWPLPPLS